MKEICIEADENCWNFTKLVELWKYVQKHWSNFSVIERNFIREHLKGYAEKIKDAEVVAKVKEHFKNE